MNPGMAIRLEQDNVDKMKVVMARFMPQYTHLDARFFCQPSYRTIFIGALDSCPGTSYGPILPTLS